MTRGRILVAHRQGSYILKFLGDVRLTLCSTLDGFLEQMFQDNQFRAVLIDLSDTECIDSTSLGQLAKISIIAKERYNLLPTIVSTNDDIDRILSSMGFDRVFIILHEPLGEDTNLSELPIMQDSEQVVRHKVLDAHRALMQLNEQNHEAFKDLVCTLENSCR